MNYTKPVVKKSTVATIEPRACTTMSRIVTIKNFLNIKKYYCIY